jgi:virulence-associated protein VapD
MFEILTLGATLLGGISEKKASNRAAEAAREVGEFNAGLIERDIDLLERQREIINRNAVLQERIDRFRFAEIQGSVVAQYSAAGIDVSHGTPMRVLRKTARKFEYDQAVADFNNAVTNMQINDQQENARLSAELSRMEGGAQAANLRAQGTTSLIQSFGQAARFGYSSGMFG